MNHTQRSIQRSNGSSDAPEAVAARAESILAGTIKDAIREKRTGWSSVEVMFQDGIPKRTRLKIEHTQ